MKWYPSNDKIIISSWLSQNHEAVLLKLYLKPSKYGTSSSGCDLIVAQIKDLATNEFHPPSQKIQALLSCTGDSKKMVRSDQIVKIWLSVIDTTNEAKLRTLAAEHPNLLVVEYK